MAQTVRIQRSPGLLGLAAAAWIVAGCQDSFDSTRTIEPYASFGEIVYRESCQRIAYTSQLDQQAAGLRARVDVSGALGRSVCIEGAAVPADAPLKLAAVRAARDGLIDAVDRLLPADLLPDVQRFMESLTPLFDDGSMERAIRPSADLLAALRDDADAVPAMHRLSSRTGYHPAERTGLLPALVQYPSLDSVIGETLALLAPGGAAETEWHTLLAAGSRSLRTTSASAQPGDPNRTANLLSSLLLTRSAALAQGATIPIVARDSRGLAVPSRTGGAFVLPFVDLDGDGLVDVDSDGRYVDAKGQRLTVPTPFVERGSASPDPAAARDAAGRALVAANGAPLYDYRDLDGSVLGAMLVEAGKLLDPNKDIAFGLLWGASALLGPSVQRSAAYVDAAGTNLGSVSFAGHDSNQSAALDLAHAMIQLLADPGADQTLCAVSAILSRHEAPIARTTAALRDASQRAKKFPDAKLPVTSTLVDEMVPVIARLLRVPGLAEDLVAALADPHVRGVGPMVARLMSARNRVDFDHANGPSYPLLAGLANIDPVDRAQPDRDYNRSLMQRITHLVHDANGAQFCNKEGASPKALGIGLGTYGKCQLFQIDDVGLFYILNMASDSIRKDKTRYATTYSKASFREQTTSDLVRNLVFDSSVGDALLTLQTSIDGFTRFPSPAALNRTLFLRPNEQSQFLQQTTVPVTCSDGDSFIDAHDQSIFAWEAPLSNNPSGFDKDSFYDALRPIIDAFARHDECLARDGSGACVRAQNAAKILLDLLGVMHEHYASPSAGYAGHVFQSTDRTLPRYTAPDNMTALEPLLAELLGQGDLLPAVIDFSATLSSMTIDGTPTGPRALPALVASARYVFDPGSPRRASRIARAPPARCGPTARPSSLRSRPSISSPMPCARRTRSSVRRPPRSSRPGTMRSPVSPISCSASRY